MKCGKQKDWLGKLWRYDYCSHYRVVCAAAASVIVNVLLLTKGDCGYEEKDRMSI